MYRVQGADLKEYGPIPAERVREWIAQGRLNRNSLASAETAPGWRPLVQFPEFAGDLGVVTAGVPGAPAPFPPAPVVSGTGALPSAMPAIQSPPQNTLAIVSLVLGILSLVFSCCCYGLPFNVAGIVCGFMALSQIRANPRQSGRGMAITGLVLSFVSLALGLVLLFVGVAFNGAEILKELHH